MRVRIQATTPSAFFDRYFEAASRWLSVANLKHRGAAIERSERPLNSLDGVALVKALVDALDGPWWGSPSSPGSNWVWRDSAPPHVTNSKEVVLERTLAKRSPERWTCQMSTSSGLRGPDHHDGRRAIDVVHRVK